MSKNSKQITTMYDPKEPIDLSEVDKVEDIEAALLLESKKILKAKQQSQMGDMRDTDYYAVVVFANKADKLAFVNSLDNVDVEGGTYIDGYQLAKSLGKEVKLTASLPKPHYVKQLKIKSNGIKLSKK